MLFLLKLPRIRWYLLILFVSGTLALGSTTAALSTELRTAERIYQQEGLTELVHFIREDLGLLPKEPEIDWETAQPEDLGLDRAKLFDLGNQLAELNTEAFLVVKDGLIAYEYYSPGVNPNHRLWLSTTGKAIVGSIALALALDAGLVELDSMAWNYIPSWKDDPLRSKVTIRHLITHSSGVENVQWGSSGLEGWKDEFDRDLSSRFHLTLNVAPIRFEPGSRFEYSSLGYYTLSYILAASLENVPERDVQTLMKNRIMDPMGIPTNAWTIGIGKPQHFDGLKLEYVGGGRYSARAIARIGQLMLNKGNWNGQQLIQPETVEALVSYGGSPAIRPSVEKEPAWGFGWRINDDGFFPSLPKDSFLALRGSNSVLLVIPSLDLVVVRFGDNLAHDDSMKRADLDERLFRPLVEAVVQR